MIRSGLALAWQANAFSLESLVEAVGGSMGSLGQWDDMMRAKVAAKWLQSAALLLRCSAGTLEGEEKEGQRIPTPTTPRRLDSHAALTVHPHIHPLFLSA